MSQEPSLGKIFFDVQRELEKARKKFPGANVNHLALVEEVGEFIRAALHWQREGCGSAEEWYKEGVQVITMVVRCLQEGDPSLTVGLVGKGRD